MRLEVKDISFQYSEDRTIFKDLTFSYETPGIMCILGSNGTGKSTLLKCLLNQNRIQKGSIRIDGKEAARYRPRNWPARSPICRRLTCRLFPFR